MPAASELPIFLNPSPNSQDTAQSYPDLNLMNVMMEIDVYAIAILISSTEFAPFGILGVEEIGQGCGGSG